MLSILIFGIIPLLLLTFSSRIKVPDIFFYTIAFLLALFLGFRGLEVGVDTKAYSIYYDAVLNGFNHMEWGWTQLCLLFNRLGANFHQFSFFISLLSMAFFVIPLNRTLKGRGRYLALFFFFTLGYYITMFNLFRQFLAISICFYAFFLVTQRLVWLSIILVLVATLFHTSALVVLPFLFINKVSIPSIGFLLGGLVVTFFLGILLSPTVLSFIAGKYSYYLETGYATRENYLTYLIFYVLTNNVFFVYFYIGSPSSVRKSYWMTLYYLSILFMDILQQMSIGPRIVYYFSIVQIIALPLSIISLGSKKPIFKFLCISYGSLNLVRFLITEYERPYGGVIPYTFMFN
ncbi:MAG: EpsG family protein [Bacteroidales bacterium]|nr:EpsG family protein [Bacteroidales bacterium]